MQRTSKQSLEIKAPILDRARMLARAIARYHPLKQCCADDVYFALMEEDRELELGPRAGVVFRTKEWEWTGRYVASRRKTNHSAVIKLWRLKE